MADNVASVSGTSNAYEYQSYTVESNDKNTLSMTDFFKLLATQLQNQDTTNPMETSEMMAQLTQMGMMQAMSSMTTAIETSTTTTAQTYAAGLIGQEITVAVTEEKNGIDVPVDVKYAKVEYVSFTNGNPSIKVEGDKKEYPLSYVLGIGKIPNPYENDGEDLGDKDDAGEDNKTEGTEGTEPEGTEGTEPEGSEQT